MIILLQCGCPRFRGRSQGFPVLDECRNECEQITGNVRRLRVRDYEERAPPLMSQSFLFQIIGLIVIPKIVLLTVDFYKVVRVGNTISHGRTENEVVAKSSAKPCTPVMTVIGTERKPRGQLLKRIFHYPFIVRLSRCPSHVALDYATGCA